MANGHGGARPGAGRKAGNPNKDKYGSPSNALKVVQLSPENMAAMNTITLRDLKTLCIQETVRALYRLNKASEALVKAPDIVHSDFLLRAFKELCDRTMGTAHTSHEETVTIEQRYSTRDELVQSLKDAGFADAEELLPPITIEGKVDDNPQ